MSILKNPDPGVTDVHFEGIDYRADDEGEFNVDNGEHVAFLIGYCGFVDVTPVVVVRSEPEAQPEPEPDDQGDVFEGIDFDKMPNRGALHDWLVANGVETHAVTDGRDELIAACKARAAELVAADDE